MKYKVALFLFYFISYINFGVALFHGEVLIGVNLCFFLLYLLSFVVIWYFIKLLYILIDILME